MNPLEAFMSLMHKGGNWMWPIMACSIISLAIFAERVYTLRKFSIDSEWLMQQLALFLQERKIAETIDYLRQNDTPLTRVLETGMMRFDKDKDDIESAMLNAINEQTPYIDKSVNHLGTIAVIAPFLGLLGTVTGMIISFEMIARTGASGPAVIAGGIYEALYATAGGLAVAIPSVIFYNVIKGIIKNMLGDMEVCANKLVELIMYTRKGEPFPEDLLPEGYEPQQPAPRQ